jgi:C1A family cysteine protease
MRRYDYSSSPLDATGTHHMQQLCGMRIEALPTTVDDRQLIVEVLDQGNEGSCVAHGIVQAMRAAMVRTTPSGTPTPELPSRNWVYWLGRAEDQDTGDDAGTVPSSCLDGIYLDGFPPESAWPYQPSTLMASPTWVVTRRAADQRWLTGYTRLDCAGPASLTDIKTALAAEHLVVFGTDVDAAFEGLGKGVVWPGVTGEVLGGHCMCIVGYDDAKRAFLVLNSWGDWCDDGYCWISYNALSGFSDVWVIEVVPSYSGTV